jgi:hypothetical protein
MLVLSGDHLADKGLFIGNEELHNFIFYLIPEGLTLPFQGIVKNIQSSAKWL